MISKKFIKSSFNYSVIGALPLASSLILIPFYTNHLTTNDLGLVYLFIGFTGLIQTLVNLAIDHYIVYHYYDAKDNLQKVKEIVGTSTIILLIWGVITVIIFSIFGTQLFNYYTEYLTKEKTGISFFPYGFFCILTAIFNSFFKTYTGLLIAQQKPVQYFWFNISNFFLTIIISLAGIYLFPFTLIGPMYGRLLSGVIIFLMALIAFGLNFGFTFNKHLLKDIYKFCYPLFFNFNVLWAIGYLGVFILLYYSTKSDVGIYNFIISTTALIEFLQSGLTSAIYPKLFDLWNKEKIKYNTPEINKYFNAYTGIGLLFIPLFVLTIPLIVPFVVKNTVLYQGFIYLPIVGVGFTFRGIQNIYNSSILYLKKTKKVAKINIYTFIFQIIVTIVLMKYFGLAGAFWSFLMVKPFQTLVFYFETKNMFTYNMNYKKQMLIPFMYLAIAIVMYPFYHSFNNHLLNLIQLLFVWTITYLVYKNELITFYKTFILKKILLKN